MGQVPRRPLGIVGDGKAAAHFTRYLELLSIPFRQWSRHSKARDGITAAEALAECDTVFVLIKDAQIEAWITDYAPQGFPRGSDTAQRFVHFSGALVTKLATGIHPLMTFGNQPYELAEYQAISFVGETGRPTLPEIIPELRNPFFAIPAEEKPLYHALCVMSGNFTVLLWRKFFAELEIKFGIPLEAAVPYLDRVARNLRENPMGALTGPLARGDVGTLQSNLRALEGDRFQAVYQSFIDAGLPRETKK